MKKNEASCPACEFKNEMTRAQTALSGGMLVCEGCGNRWRNSDDISAKATNKLTFFKPLLEDEMQPNGHTGSHREDTGNADLPPQPDAMDYRSLTADKPYEKIGNRWRKTGIKPTVVKTIEFDQPIPIEMAEANGRQFSTATVGGAFAVVIALSATIFSSTVAPQFTNQNVDQMVVASTTTGGLKIDRVNLAMHSKVDGTAAVVSGVIENPTSTLLSVPEFKIRLKGDADQEVYSWIFNSNVKMLKPGAKLRFTTSMAGIPENAKSAAVDKLWDAQ